MTPRYGGLKKATITVREDGMLDVVRERATTGESFRGLANIEEAFEVIRAHGGDLRRCKPCGGVYPACDREHVIRGNGAPIECTGLVRSTATSDDSTNRKDT